MTTEVTVPRWAVILVLDPGAKRCNTCTGWSPSWDGHDANPPCIGYAREVLKAALTSVSEPIGTFVKGHRFGPYKYMGMGESGRACGACGFMQDERLADAALPPCSVLPPKETT